LCPAVALSHQDGRHSAVALLLKAALIQVSDYRLLGASGYQFYHNKYQYSSSIYRRQSSATVYCRTPMMNTASLIVFIATCRWFSPGTPVSSTNKTDSHDIAEILLKVTLTTINP
jgi:hypothetical protein